MARLKSPAPRINDLCKLTIRLLCSPLNWNRPEAAATIEAASFCAAVIGFRQERTAKYRSDAVNAYGAVLRFANMRALPSPDIGESPNWTDRLDELLEERKTRSDQRVEPDEKNTQSARSIVEPAVEDEHGTRKSEREHNTTLEPVEIEQPSSDAEPIYSEREPPPHVVVAHATLLKDTANLVASGNRDEPVNPDEFIDLPPVARDNVPGEQNETADASNTDPPQQSNKPVCMPDDEEFDSEHVPERTVSGSEHDLASMTQPAAPPPATSGSSSELVREHASSIEGRSGVNSELPGGSPAIEVTDVREDPDESPPDATEDELPQSEFAFARPPIADNSCLEGFTNFWAVLSGNEPSEVVGGELPSPGEDVPELFMTPDGVTHTSRVFRGHRYTVPTQSADCARLIEAIERARTGASPKRPIVEQIRREWETEARFSGIRKEVFLRVGGTNDCVHIDIGDDSGRVIEVSANGWTILETTHVRFRRPTGLLALPMPERGGNLNELKPFLNVPPEQFPLVVATQSSQLLPRGPYVVTVYIGEQGSAKSTTTAAQRRIVDPVKALLRRPPRTERDLWVAANNSWMLTMENVSDLPNWLSDGLCALATGAGDSRRRNFSDADEVTFDASRPVILNGIGSFVTRNDLRDRAVIIECPPLAPSARKDEATFWGEFDRALPRIFGALLDLMAGAIRELPAVKLQELPRMADFARWCRAVEIAAGWEMDSVLGAYLANREQGATDALDDAFTAGVLDLVAGESTGQWQGTAAELLLALERITRREVRGPHWPKGPEQIGTRLRQIAPVLRARGVEVRFLPRSGRRRPIRLEPATINATP